jgi:hypothetical protein
LSADESHSAKVKAGMELSRQHKAGEHVEFNKECARCKAEARERGKRPAMPAAQDTTGDVSFGDFSEQGGTITIPPPPGDPSYSVQGATPAPPSGDPTSATYVEPPPPKDQKTPEQKEQEHRAAVAAAAAAEQEARTPVPPIFGKPGTRGGDQDGELVFHVLHDGFTVLGAVWYRGQEIAIKPGSAYDQLSTDTRGRRWYEMTNEEQMTRFGQLMFGVGPWPYSAPTDAANDDAYIRALNSSDPEAMRRYEKEQQRRAAPPVPVSRT